MERPDGCLERGSEAPAATLIPVCAGGDPPTCCQPDPPTPAQLRAREERIEAAIGAKRDRTPSRCPRCGSEEICPMFDDDMLLSLCTDCGRPFCEAD